MFKKIFSALLAISLCFSMSTIAFAAENNATTQVIYEDSNIVVMLGNPDILIDKGSGLLLKTTSHDSLVLNYPGTDVQRGIYDDVSNFEFKLDVVNDSDITNSN